MASPLRLDPRLVEQAEVEGRLHKRTVPKQIEYWAELGKSVQQVIDPETLVAITQGLVKVNLEPVVSFAADPDEVFEALARDRQEGRLSAEVTGASVYYEASRTHPGLLDRVSESGVRETGKFHNGEFIVSGLKDNR